MHKWTCLSAARARNVHAEIIKVTTQLPIDDSDPRWRVEMAEALSPCQHCSISFGRTRRRKRVDDQSSSSSSSSVSLSIHRYSWVAQCSAPHDSPSDHATEMENHSMVVMASPRFSSASLLAGMQFLSCEDFSRFAVMGFARSLVRSDRVGEGAPRSLTTSHSSGMEK